MAEEKANGAAAERAERTADKSRLLEALRARVTADLEALERRQKDIQDGATHEESRAEHAKDTRATEQSYLARGLAERVIELQRTATALAGFEVRPFARNEAVAVGAVVVISNDEAEEGPEMTETWFIVPLAGGIELEEAGGPIRTVTPLSPVGRALLGLVEGEEGTVKTPRGERSFEVLEVR